MKYYLALLGFLILYACGVKQPVETVQTQRTGIIYVTSQPDSALIFLDGQNTFLLTPDTLKNIPEGTHYLQVQKDGYHPLQDSILVQVAQDTIRTVFFELKKLVYIGLLYVNSDPQGAEIYVDGQSSGKYTPDTLQMEPGTHQITVDKNGFKPYDFDVEVQADSFIVHETALEIQQRVLFESFGNVSCDPCVESAENLERFRSEHDMATFALFEYFANWPSPNDPFYNESPQDVDQRVRYYKVYALPSLRLNGQTGVDASKYEEIENAYTTALAQQNTPLAVSVSRRLEDDSLKILVELYDYGQVLEDNQLRLFVAVYEDSIHFDTAPGTNNLTDFNFVFRKFLSGLEGDPITANTFRYAFKWPDWEFSNSHVIAYVQNMTTQKVLQTTIK